MGSDFLGLGFRGLGLRRPESRMRLGGGFTVQGSGRKGGVH